MHRPVARSSGAALKGTIDIDIDDHAPLLPTLGEGGQQRVGAESTAVPRKARTPAMTRRRPGWPGRRRAAQALASSR